MSRCVSGNAHRGEGASTQPPFLSHRVPAMKPPVQAPGMPLWGQITRAVSFHGENEAQLHLYKLFCLTNYFPFPVMCLPSPS